MGSHRRFLFDLNEPPTENEDDNVGVVNFHPQRAIPSSSTAATKLFMGSAGPQGILNNHAFSHSSSVSGFQPFVRSKVLGSDLSSEKRSSGDLLSDFASLTKLSNDRDLNATPSMGALDIEKEEGEWSDAECPIRNVTNRDSSGTSNKQVMEKGMVQMVESNLSVGGVENRSASPSENKNEHSNSLLGKNLDTNDKKVDASMDGQDDSSRVPKQRETRRGEASHASKCASNMAKRPKLGQHKQAMLLC